MENSEEYSFNSQLNEFKKELRSYKKYTEDYFNSSNYLIKTLYVDYELNKANHLMNYVQSASLELLEFVGHICEEHDLTWWLDYGNLLGAVRHGNFVPWDDDVDIGMMREDYIKFDKIITKDVKKYGLDEIIEVGYRPHVRDFGIPRFIQVYVRHKVAKSGDNKVVLGNVDVFPYEYIREYDPQTLDEEYFDSKWKYFNNLKHHFNLQFCFDTYYEDLNLTFEPTKCIIPGVEGTCCSDEVYYLIVFDYDKLFPLNEIEFAGKVFPCPNDVDYYLSKIYKDYLSIPKSLYKHDRINYFRYNEDNDEVYEKCLKMLREVNSEFNK